MYLWVATDRYSASPCSVPVRWCQLTFSLYCRWVCSMSCTCGSLAAVRSPVSLLTVLYPWLWVSTSWWSACLLYTWKSACSLYYTCKSLAACGQPVHYTIPVSRYHLRVSFLTCSVRTCESLPADGESVLLASSSSWYTKCLIFQSSKLMWPLHCLLWCQIWYNSNSIWETGSREVVMKKNRGTGTYRREQMKVGSTGTVRKGNRTQWGRETGGSEKEKHDAGREYGVMKGKQDAKREDRNRIQEASDEGRQD